MSEKLASYARKVKRAAQMLLYKRHMKPGVKGWELRRTLGKDYTETLDLLNTQLEPLGFSIKTVFEESEPEDNPDQEQLDRARFYVTVKESLTQTDLRTSGWRIDDVAVLAVSVSYVISKQGKAPRVEVEDILKKKFPKWKAEHAINRYIRMGYLMEDENKLLFLDWRARAEIDQKNLLKLIIGEETVN
jgi:hypothetical protein